MWDTTAPNPHVFGCRSADEVKSSGIPHLAKNERDVGHPRFVAGKESPENSPQPQLSFPARVRMDVPAGAGRGGAADGNASGIHEGRSDGPGRHLRRADVSSAIGSR